MKKVCSFLSESSWNSKSFLGETPSDLADEAGRAMLDQLTSFRVKLRHQPEGFFFFLLCLHEKHPNVTPVYRASLLLKSVQQMSLHLRRNKPIRVVLMSPTLPVVVTKK